MGVDSSAIQFVYAILLSIIAAGVSFCGWYMKKMITKVDNMSEKLSAHESTLQIILKKIGL